MRCTFFSNVTVAIVGWLLIGLSAPALVPGVELVTVVKILSNDDHGIIVRSNGDAYQIEKGVGCLSFSRYEGRKTSTGVISWDFPWCRFLVDPSR